MFVFVDRAEITGAEKRRGLLHDLGLGVDRQLKTSEAEIIIFEAARIDAGITVVEQLRVEMDLAGALALRVHGVHAHRHVELHAHVEEMDAQINVRLAGPQGLCPVVLDFLIFQRREIGQLRRQFLGGRLIRPARHGLRAFFEPLVTERLAGAVGYPGLGKSRKRW